MADPRWLTDDEQAAWRAYLLTTQLVDEVLDRQLQRDAKMPHAYYAILVALSEATEHSVRMTDLARALRYSQSRMTHAVTSLERSGWVSRRSCPTDRRSQLVSITDDGLEALRTAAPGHVEAVRRAVFDQLTPEQVTQLGEICATILNGLDAVAAPPT
jgi:DNA-binding MarR family transcriptional regulator